MFELSEEDRAAALDTYDVTHPEDWLAGVGGIFCRRNSRRGM
jgi:hypothetical protein